MNQIALAFIKEKESCELTAYQDGGGVWTIGYGATGPGITKGTVWSQDQADNDLASRLNVIEAALTKKIGQLGLSIQQMAALISLAYNVGVYGVLNSTLLKFVMNRDWLPAARSFISWDKDNGKEIKGLLIRRLQEATIFLQGTH
jgi:lysozyme